MRTLVIALALIGAAGCGLVSPTASAPVATAAPDFVRHLDAGEGIVRRLLVYDPRKLLLSVQVPTTRVRGGRYSAWWEPIAGDPNSLTFGWLGGMCGIDPNVSLATHGETNQGILLSLVVFDGHSRPECASGGINYEVILTFRKPISVFHITAEDSQEPEWTVSVRTRSTD